MHFGSTYRHSYAVETVIRSEWTEVNETCVELFVVFASSLMYVSNVGLVIMLVMQSEQYCGMIYKTCVWFLIGTLLLMSLSQAYL